MQGCSNKNTVRLAVYQMSPVGLGVISDLSIDNIHIVCMFVYGFIKGKVQHNFVRKSKMNKSWNSLNICALAM